LNYLKQKDLKGEVRTQEKQEKQEKQERHIKEKVKKILKEYPILTIGICGKEMLSWLYKAQGRGL
jgi:hypothetical protein